jgi:hypothetical protein
MRVAMVVTVVAMVAATSVANAEGGLAFTVRPGLLINAAQVGYKTDNFFIGGGLEFASASWSNSYESVQHDTTVFPETTYTYKYGTKIGASIFLPQVAAKYFWGGAAAADEDGGYARAFVGASLFYSIASVGITMTDDDSTYKDTATSRSLQGILGGNLGGTVSFGGEYHISHGLSLSAEFGVRYLFGDTDVKYHYDNYSGPEDIAMKDKLGLGFTHTTLGLNFYF